VLETGRTSLSPAQNSFYSVYVSFSSICLVDGFVIVSLRHCLQIGMLLKQIAF